MDSGCLEFKNAVHEKDGSVVCAVCGVSFVGLIYEAGGRCVPCLGRIGRSRHEFEEAVDETLG